MYTSHYQHADALHSRCAGHQKLCWHPEAGKKCKKDLPFTYFTALTILIVSIGAHMETKQTNPGATYISPMFYSSWLRAEAGQAQGGLKLDCIGTHLNRMLLCFHSTKEGEALEPHVVLISCASRLVKVVECLGA